MIRRTTSILAFLLVFDLAGRAQDAFSGGAQRSALGGALSDSINKLAGPARGRVGTYIQDLESADSCSTNGHEHFSMLSVFKFPLALYVLDQVDKGKLSLEQPIEIRKKEWGRMWSPLLNKYKEKRVSLPLQEVLAATVGSSDNVGCDLLFRLVGGPEVVNAYIHRLGVEEINIVATEMQMAADWNVQYQNWSTPFAMNLLLQKFYTGQVLSPTSTKLLLQWMIESNSPKRIQGLLPAGTVVAHKTGTSNTNAAGLTAATNDVGIITLPHNHHLIVVVYVSDAMADAATRENVISRIAKAAYDGYEGGRMIR